MTPYKIAFFHVGAACHGRSKKIKPLGGTESAMIDMAEALAQRGHEVHVFSLLDDVGPYEGVQYHSFEAFESFSLNKNWDVFIGIRQLLPLLVKRWAAYQIYFTPDAYDQPFFKQALQVDCSLDSQNWKVGLYSLKFVSHWVDKIYCVGQWQAQSLAQAFQVPLSKFFVTGNGIWPQLFKPLPFSERKKRIVYASTPSRGLEYLLDYFPTLRRENPGLECWVMSGMQLYGLSAEQDQQQYAGVYQKAKQEGVHLLGPVSKSELYSIFSQSLAMAYPNTFAETFCIAVLEAQAAGLPVVTTRLAALEERIEEAKEGFLISGHPSQETYQEDFISKMNQVLQSPSLWNPLSAQALEKSRRFSYEILAQAWEKDFDLFFQDPEKNKSPRPDLFFPKQEFLTVKGEDQKTAQIEISPQIIQQELNKYLNAFNFKSLM
ncbi:MAG: glycosyltransferase family 4 protein [Deltaproteobacteria bacterium]|nr:glycosyltransferase family 4 protein [Deltaproteobacteria bacterium]